MTDDQAAAAIDAAHKSYRDALGTDRERSAFLELNRVVCDVKFALDMRDWAALEKRFSRSA